MRGLFHEEKHGVDTKGLHRTDPEEPRLLGQPHRWKSVGRVYVQAVCECLGELRLP